MQIHDISSLNIWHITELDWRTCLWKSDLVETHDKPSWRFFFFLCYFHRIQLYDYNLSVCKSDHLKYTQIAVIYVTLVFQHQVCSKREVKVHRKRPTPNGFSKVNICAKLPNWSHTLHNHRTKLNTQNGLKGKDRSFTQLCYRLGFNACPPPPSPFFHLISQAQGLPQNNQCLLDTPLAAESWTAWHSGNLQTPLTKLQSYNVAKLKSNSILFKRVFILMNINKWATKRNLAEYLNQLQNEIMWSLPKIHKAINYFYSFLIGMINNSAPRGCYLLR